ncbi:MAG: hypothetical protein AAB638_02625 [Patescibacteria group bacterium]
MRSLHTGLRYFTKSIAIAVGIILIWRGIWIIFDLIDNKLFGGNHIITAVAGIIFGLIILYIPERNLEALERL